MNFNALVECAFVRAPTRRIAVKPTHLFSDFPADIFRNALNLCRKPSVKTLLRHDCIMDQLMNGGAWLMQWEATAEPCFKRGFSFKYSEDIVWHGICLLTIDMTFRGCRYETV